MPSTDDRNYLLRAGVPQRLLHCTFDTWEGDRPEVDGSGGMVLITGPVGTGKSHLAIAMGHHSARQMVLEAGSGTAWRQDEGRPTGRRVSYNGFHFRDIQESVERMKPGWEDADELETVRHCSLLVYDDLGAERLTDFTVDRVSFVLRYRYNACLPTIVTTNLKPSELAATDPRLASRLCSGVVIRRSGADRRVGGKR